MVFVFGVDLPMVEVLLMLSLVTIIVLVEVTVMMIVLIYQIKRSKETTLIMHRMSQIFLEIERIQLGKKKQ